MHKEVRTHLEACLDRSLPPSAQRGVENHLRSCPECRQEMEDARLTSEWMQALVTGPMIPAPGFYERVRARIKAEGKPVWPFWQLWPAFSRQLGFAVFTLALLLGSYFFTLRLTEQGGAAAELMLEAPVIRTETPALTADTHTNRERVMLAIVAPLGRVEGD